MFTLLTQDMLIELGKLLNYKSLEKGMCRGFASMFAQAMMANDLESFLARLKLIASYEGRLSTLVAEINAAKEKVKKGEILSSEEREKLDIAAFYDGITLYLRPEEHEDVFNTPFMSSQVQVEKIYSIAHPEKLATQPLTILLKKSRAFTQESLKTYLDDLKTIATPATPMILGNGKHAVLLSFDNKIQKWIYCDTNRLNSGIKSNFQLETTNKLVNAIFDAFDDDEHPCTVFQTPPVSG